MPKQKQLPLAPDQYEDDQKNQLNQSYLIINSSIFNEIINKIIVNTKFLIKTKKLLIAKKPKIRTAKILIKTPEAIFKKAIILISISY